MARFTGKAVEQLPIAGPNEMETGGCNMAADLAGDYRDEVICTGGQAVYIYTSTEPIKRREITRTANREYRMWLARNRSARLCELL